MPVPESPEPARGVGPIIDGALQALGHLVGASWVSMSFLRSTKLYRLAVSAGDRANGPGCYPNMRDIVLGLDCGVGPPAGWQ